MYQSLSEPYCQRRRIRRIGGFDEFIKPKNFDLNNHDPPWTNSNRSYPVGSLEMGLAAWSHTQRPGMYHASKMQSLAITPLTPKKHMVLLSTIIKGLWRTRSPGEGWKGLPRVHQINFHRKPLNDVNTTSCGLLLCIEVMPYNTCQE